MDSGVGGRKQTEEEVAKKFGFEDYFIEGKGDLLLVASHIHQLDVNTLSVETEYWWVGALPNIKTISSLISEMV